MRKHDFFRLFSPVVDRVLPTLDCLLAVNGEYEDQIYGFMLYKGDSIVFPFTKLVYRNAGVFSKLMSECRSDGIEFKKYVLCSSDKYFNGMVKKNNIQYDISKMIEIFWSK